MSFHAPIDPGHLIQRPGALMEIEAGQCRCAGYWIGGVAVTMGQCSGEVVAEEGIEEVVRCDRHGQRQDASGNSLGEADQIGNESGLLIGKEAPRPPESRHHFVKDHGDTTFPEHPAKC